MNPISYSIHQEHRNNALKALEKAKQLLADRLYKDSLLKLGFEVSPIIDDCGLRYQSFHYGANDSYISITNILDQNGKLEKRVFSINDREINRPLTLKEVKDFINIIN